MYPLTIKQQKYFKKRPSCKHIVSVQRVKN